MQINKIIFRERLASIAISSFLSYKLFSTIVLDIRISEFNEATRLAFLLTSISSFLLFIATKFEKIRIRKIQFYTFIFLQFFYIISQQDLSFPEIANYSLSVIVSIYIADRLMQGKSSFSPVFMAVAMGVFVYSYFTFIVGQFGANWFLAATIGSQNYIASGLFSYFLLLIEDESSLWLTMSLIPFALCWSISARTAIASSFFYLIFRFFRAKAQLLCFGIIAIAFSPQIYSVFADKWITSDISAGRFSLWHEYYSLLSWRNIFPRILVEHEDLGRMTHNLILESIWSMGYLLGSAFILILIILCFTPAPNVMIKAGYLSLLMYSMTEPTISLNSNLISIIFMIHFSVLAMSLAHANNRPMGLVNARNDDAPATVHSVMVNVAGSASGSKLVH